MHQSITPSVNAAKELSEISRDFTSPLEVLREAIHNSYDADATDVSIRAFVEKTSDGRRTLSLEIRDNGIGMDAAAVERLFGLGHSDKPTVSRTPIGMKGHGAKIYYQAQRVTIVSQRAEHPLCVVDLPGARESIFAQRLPEPRLYENDEAAAIAKERHIEPPAKSGTIIRLTDFTADSSRLIDKFRSVDLECYLRWFSVYGSWEHTVRAHEANARFVVKVKGTDDKEMQIEFGHRWGPDRTDMKQLKKEDERRPFNLFRKTFRFYDHDIEGGYKIDVLIMFEGKKARLERDPWLARQRVGGLYSEDERYGLWLCKDFIPIDKRFEWLSDAEIPADLSGLRRPLMFVNSQDFSLIANRNSVGNSSEQLLNAVRKAVHSLLERVVEDPALQTFLEDYREDLFSRAREKDKKALQKRIDRYNRKQEITITLTDKSKHTFFEPTREITLFGLISELRVLDPSLLDFRILDYDDHVGIDLLVARNGTPHDQLDRQRVAYVELKYELGTNLNHAFDQLHAIVCWDTALRDGDYVDDATGEKFRVDEGQRDGLTSTNLNPAPGATKHNHVVRVTVLKRLLREKYGLSERANPSPISTTRRG